MKTVAKKLAWLYGKRGFLLAASVLAAALNAKGVPFGFFDGA
ncbi:MAG TPA: hypothetical protein VGP56_01860 [Gaiellaceae bacterium]|nr:hypothetical protein [Gaiellaceae bacterium]